MFKRKFHTMIKRSLAGMLCAGLLVTQPATIYAAEANATATPEAGHSATYSRLLILTPSKDGLPGQVLKDSPLY